MLEIRISGKYRLGKKIGKGSFGDIYLGVNIQNNEEVAIKLENINTRHLQLSYESKIIKILQDNEGFPSLNWYGTEGGFNILVIDLLGPSLEDLLNYCNRKFSLKTILMIAEQVFARIETLHTKNFLHRDVKPDNFLIGLGDKSKTVYLIDFGLSKKYRDTKNQAHIQMSTGKTLIGTARYASINSHMGLEQGRRDDIESIFYMLAYFFMGSLPWQGVVAGSKQEKYTRIMDRKRDALNAGSFHDLPTEFLSILTYAKSLKFEDKPDYVYLKAVIRDLMNRERMSTDFIFDWTIRNYTSHKSLNNRIIEELRRGNVLTESKVAIHESNVSAVDVPVILTIAKQNEVEGKGKCAVF